MILEAIRPAAITAAEQAAEQLAANREQERQLIVDRLEAAQETETRAAREYKKTDATYATVRQKLAQEWEEALLALQRQQEELKATIPSCANQRIGENHATIVRI